MLWGIEGVVSLEGILVGVVVFFAIVVVGWIVGLIDLIGIVFCVILVFIVINLESLIGVIM